MQDSDEFEYSQVDIDDAKSPENDDDATDVAGFCEAAAATVRENAAVPPWAEERMTRPELMDHLWLLVEFYGMPVTREGGRGPQSEWQMLVLLQAVCKFEVEGIGVPMIQPKEDDNDEAENTTVYYGKFVEVNATERTPPPNPTQQEEPEIITASPIERQKGSQQSIQQIDSSGESQFVVSTGFTFASDEDQNGAKGPPMMVEEEEDDDTTKPPMRPGTVIDDISPFEEENRRPKRQHSLKNYFPKQDDMQHRRRDEAINPEDYYPHRVKNKPYTRSRRPVPFPQAIKPQTDPRPLPNSQVRGGILGTPAPRLPKPISDPSPFDPPPSATTLHQLAKGVIDKNSHISTTILPDFSQHRRSSAPPLPLDADDLESSSSKPRNITLNDVHYVYNVTFDDKKPYSAKHNEDEYYQIQPEITTTGVASDVVDEDYYLNFYYDDEDTTDSNIGSGKTPLPLLPGFKFTTDNIQPRSKTKRPTQTTPIPYYPQNNKPIRGQLPPMRKKPIKLGHELSPFHAPPDTHMTYGTRTPMTNHDYPEIEDLTASADDDSMVRPHRHHNKPRVKSDLTLLGSSGQGLRRRNRNQQQQQHRKPIRTMQRVPIRKNQRPPPQPSFDDFNPEPKTTTATTTTIMTTSTTTTTTTTTTRTTTTTTLTTTTTTTTNESEDEYEYYYVYSDEDVEEGDLEAAYNDVEESSANEKAPRFDDDNDGGESEERDFFPAGPKLSPEELIISTEDPYREDYSTNDFGTDSRLADQGRKASYFGNSESSELNVSIDDHFIYTVGPNIYLISCSFSTARRRCHRAVACETTASPRTDSAPRCSRSAPLPTSSRDPRVIPTKVGATPWTLRNLPTSSLESAADYQCSVLLLWPFPSATDQRRTTGKGPFTLCETKILKNLFCTVGLMMVAVAIVASASCAPPAAAAAAGTTRTAAAATATTTATWAPWRPVR